MELSFGADDSDGLSVGLDLAQPWDVIKTEVSDVLSLESIAENVPAHPVKAALGEERSHESSTCDVGGDFLKYLLVDMSRTSDDPKLGVLKISRIGRAESDFSNEVTLGGPRALICVANDLGFPFLWFTREDIDLQVEAAGGGDSGVGAIATATYNDGCH